MNDNSPNQISIWTLPVICAIAIGLALRLFLTFATPIGGSSSPGRLSSYNDELAHANYVQSLRVTGRLPVHIKAIQDPGAVDLAIYENYQPPLYYWVVVTSTKIVGIFETDDIVILGRLLNVIILIGTGLIFMKIGMELNLNPLMTGAGLIFIAVNGVMVRFGSTLGNDPLLWFFCGWMILSVVRLRRDGFTLTSGVLFVISATLSVYTKLTILLLFPILSLYAARPGNRRRQIMDSLAMLAIMLLLTLPVWLRNIQHFGEFVPLIAGFGRPEWRMPDLSTFAYAMRSFVFPWSEFWRGWIGLLITSIPLIYPLYGLALNKRKIEGMRNPVLVAVLCLSFLGFLWLNCRYDQAEGRYLYAAWPALALLFASPIAVRSRQWLFLGVWCVPYLLFIFPRGV